MALTNDLRFITGFRYAENTLRTINGLTFFLDPNWAQGNASTRTFPIAFFHLKGIQEIMESDVQTKRMLFYNSQNTVSADSVTGSLLNVVADNIVNRPKQYRLDIVVPYEDLTLLFNTAVAQTYQISAVSTVLTTGERDSKLTSFMASATPYVEVMKGLLNSLVNLGGITSDDWLSSITSTPMYNKDSLEAMWRNRTIVKMKLWNGWRFRYVVITGMTVTKLSDEHGVEEATLTCTELPVMTMRTTAQALKASKTKPIFVENAVKSVIQKAANKLGAGEINI